MDDAQFGNYSLINTGGAVFADVITDVMRAEIEG